MKKQKWSLLAMLFAALLVLAACNGDGDKDKDTGKDDGGKKEEPKELAFETSVENEGTAIKGGTLMVAMQKDEPFQGIFSYALYEDGYDDELLKFASNKIFETDGDFLFTNEGIASMEVNQESKVVTVKIREGIKWSDGEPLKIEDLILPYNIIGHKDYEGVRYDSDFQNIVGAVEYHDGKAETISGLKKVDETTLEIQLKDISPGIFSGGDGLLYYAEPSHILGSVAVKDLLEHDAIRKNPVTLGAFVVEKVVSGESVQYKANPNYWKGAPKLDGVIVKVVPSASIAKALESGEYDVTSYFGSSKYPEIEGLTNIDILARPELYYNYIGFKLGKWDAANGTVATDIEGSKMGDVKLRQAMAYAMNVEEVNEVFYDGLRTRANAIVPPVFTSFHDKSLEGYSYDPEKANALLDEAGYKDVDGDGIREDKAGKPFEIKFATMSGDDVAEQISAFWLQNWEEVGLKVVYTDGRTIEFNSFYDKVEADDPNIDIFMAAWGVGSNPSPSGVYSDKAEFNFTRYSSPELTTILKDIDSSKSFDADFRAEQFLAFEQHIAENAPVVPLQYRLELAIVNKRVKSWNIDYANEVFSNLHDVELVADKPVAQ
ncbi:oligopeptide ABC transporter substrate-binding protein [Lysinibacillus sp. 54212]|uniref:oligopeptide ABC transporter substrate-binding protein n=1 Tax=Lysinibacillus sp. 54212 TaxID=3119829 RepID=UPI002FC73E37